MLRKSLLLMLICTAAHAYCADYYWVGNSGNWSDISNWATSSGGSVKHLTTPTVNDNVFFDANSFKANGITISINNDISYCNDLSIVGVNNPIFVSTTKANKMVISGSISFTGLFAWNYDGDVLLQSNTLLNKISCNGKTLATNVIINGLGSWDFTNAINISGIFNFEMGEIIFSSGISNIGKFKSLTTLPRKITWGSASVFINSSSEELYLNQYYSDQNSYNFHINSTNLTSLVSNPSALLHLMGKKSHILIRGNSDIILPSVVYGRGNNNLQLVSENSTKILSSGFITAFSNMEVLTDIAFSTMTLNEGIATSFAPNKSYKLDTLKGNGTCQAPIAIFSTQIGEQVTINLNAASTMSTVAIRDINIPKNNLTVNNGSDLGNNTGVSINPKSKQTFYWVGRNGKWTDGNNWAVISGGTPTGCIPSATDDVIFDDNSFTAAGQFAQIDSTNIFVNTMRWMTNVRKNAGLSGDLNSNLYLNGSMYLSNNMINNFGGNIYLTSSQKDNELQSSGIVIQNDLIINNVNGAWKLLDTLSVYDRLQHISGELQLSGKQLRVCQYYSESKQARKLNMSNSTMELNNIFFKQNNFGPYMRIAQEGYILEAQNSEVIFKGNISGALDYFRNDYISPNPPSATASFDRITFNLLGRLNKNTNIANFSIRKLTLLSDGDFFCASTIVIDTLIIQAKSSYSISSSFSNNTLEELDVKVLINKTACNDIAYIRKALNTGKAQIRLRNTATLDNIYLKGIEILTPSGNIIANSSIDGGENKGVTFNIFNGRKLYFVHHEPISNADWNNSQNWSKISGGVGGECIPTILDTVIFDDNSFQDLTTQYVSIGGSISPYVKDFIFRTKNYKNSFHIGFLKIAGDMLIYEPFNFNTYVEAIGDRPQYWWTPNSTVYTLRINKTDTLYLNSDLVTTFAVEVQKGSLVTRSNSITTSGLSVGEYQGLQAYANYMNSVITLTNASPYLQNTYLVTNNANIIDNGAVFNFTSETPSIRLEQLTMHNRWNFTNINGEGRIFSNKSQHVKNMYFSNSAVFKNLTEFPVIPIEYISDTVVFAPGKSYQYSSGDTWRIGKLLKSIGNNCNPITFKTNSTGMKSTIIMPSASLLVMNFTQLQDLTANGGNSFNAGAFSTDVNKSNVGWFFPDRNTITADIGILGSDLNMCNGTKVVLNAFTNTSDEKYTWNTGAKTASIEVTNAGKYIVEVVYGNGCKIVDTINVDFVATPAFSLGADQNGCADQIKVLRANAALFDSIVWNTGLKGNALLPSQSGTYSATAYNGQCLFSDTVLVTIIQSPTLFLGNDTTLCHSQNLVLKNKTKPGESIVWNDGTTKDSIIVSSAGVYHATVNNGFCSTHDTVKVAYLALSSNFLGVDTTLCNGDSLILNPQLSNANYLWSTGSSNPSIKVKSAGQITLEVTQAQCKSKDTIIINVIDRPSPNVPKSLSLCGNTRASINITCCNFDNLITWSDGINTNPKNFTTAGTYYYTATNGQCAITDSVIINVLSLTSFDLGADTSICAGQTKALTIAAKPTERVTWSNGQSGNTISVTTSGKYVATLSEGACSIKDSIMIDVKALPGLAINDSYTLCDNQGLTLSLPANSVDSAKWNDVPTLSFDVYKTGNLTLVGYKNGCSTTKIIPITDVVFPPENLPTRLEKCETEPIELAIENPNNLDVVWSTGEKTNTIRYSSKSDTVKVTLTQDGCRRTYATYVESRSCTEFTLFAPNALVLGSPINGEFKIEVPSSTKVLTYEISIFDRNGNLIFANDDMANGWRGTISGSIAMQGIYTYVIKMTYDDDFVKGASKTRTGSIALLYP